MTLASSKCSRLTALLAKSIDRNCSTSLLLSGGLDSSILASLAKPECCVTVGLGDAAPDFPFAREIAKKYCTRHVEVILKYDENLIEIVQNLIQILKTFDPMEIRNSSVFYAGISEAKRNGYSSVMTGDGGDELFAGYNYLTRHYNDPEKLDLELRRLWRIMHFSSKKIGKALAIDNIKTPFLDSNFMSYAKSMDVSEKIGVNNGKVWSKLILRKCFEEELGKQIAWRPKLAQEEGAQTTLFKKLFSSILNDATFELESKKALEEGVKIRDKEHLYYYLIYKQNFSIPKKQNDCLTLRCPECLGSFEWYGTNFCRTCGSFPIVPIEI